MVQLAATFRSELKIEADQLRISQLLAALKLNEMSVVLQKVSMNIKIPAPSV